MVRTCGIMSTLGLSWMFWRAAQDTTSRGTLSTLNFLVFGMIMPKGIVSLGDGKWHRKVRDITTALRTYIAQDISQATAIAWVLLTCWILQVFPDGT
jgi:hypothetical protein